MSSLWKRRGFTVSGAVLVVAAFASPSLAATEVDGLVSSADGKPVAGAVVALRGADGEHRASTDASGHFAFPALATGSYSVLVLARGYNPLEQRVISVGDEREDLRLSLVRSASSLVTIGRASVAGGDALSTSTVPTTTIDTQQYASEGYTRVSDVLFDDPSTTLVHPLAGGSNLATSVALRGPDPTETLVDVDGHQVNNGNTGDFDLSLLDPADYASIELVKGISPSSLVGPDTIDGAINIRTLEPTAVPHGALRFSVGSFNSYAETLETTGTTGRLGYALSLHRTTSDGEVNQPIFDLSTNTAANVGSAFDGSTLLGKLRYAFGRDGDAYAELSFHDQTQFRDLSAALSSLPGADGESEGDDGALRHVADADGAAPGAGLLALDGEQGSTLQTRNTAYGLDVRVPLGGTGSDGVARTTALFRHYSSDVGESVFGPAVDTSPYLDNSRDLIGDDSLEIDHLFSNSSLTFQYGIRSETLSTDFIPGVVNEESVARFPQALRRFDDDGGDSTAQPGVSVVTLPQTQRSAVLRYQYDPTSRLHVTAATYYSNYSIFGTSFDPRFGLSYDPDARTVARFSVGTTYQAPQLPELLVPPVLPNPVGDYISIGNPNLKPDRATEYNLGISHIFETGARRTDVSLDLYRVNLRQPATPTVPELDPDCGPISTNPNVLGGDGTKCAISMPINAGDGVYQGIELSASRRIAADTTVRAGFAVRSAYLTAVPSIVQDGTLVIGEQDLGLPLQKGTLSIRRAPQTGLTYNAGLIYEGLYNELNQPQFAVINAGIGYRWKSYEVGLFGSNLTDVYDQRFTHSGAGVSYGSLMGPLPQDAYVLQGTALTLTLARRF